MKPLFLFFIPTILCCSFLIADENFQKEESQVNNSLLVGSSRDNPIVFKGINDFNKLKEEQDRYIKKNYDGYIEVTKITYVYKERYIYQVTLKNDLGQEKTLYFDTTEASLAYQKKNKAKIQRLKKEAEKFQKIKMPKKDKK